MRRLLTVTLLLSTTSPLNAAEESNTSLWGLIQQGGWAMIPLALASMAMLTLAIHCFRETRAKNFSNQRLLDQITRHLQTGNLDQARQLVRQEPTALARSFSTALEKYDPAHHQHSVAAIEEEIAASLELEENAVSQWIHYLAVIASVAPMIGLLGTVSGMIGGFQTMASGGMGRPELFAGDIGEALITTATGLCIGIPAMIAHSYFNNRLNTLIVTTTREASQATEALAKSQAPH